MAYLSYADGFIVIVNEKAPTTISRADLRKAFLNKTKEKQPISVYEKKDKKAKEVTTKFLKFALKDEDTNAGTYKVEQIKKKITYSANVTTFVKDWKGMIAKVSTDKQCVGFLPKSYATKLPKNVKICKVK
jgi:ABC-type phosphate transport system substrate-binding protein